MRLTGEFRIKDFTSVKGTHFTGNQINASPENSEIDELAINYTGYNGGITQFRNFNVYNGKKQSLFNINGATGKVVIGAPGSSGNLLTVYGNISATGVIYGGAGSGSTFSVANLSASGANDGDVLTYVVQNVVTNNPVTSNPVTTPSTARFRGSYGITIDSSDNLYVADYGNSTIRKITPAGVVSTLAGAAGQQGSSDGIGSVAKFTLPFGIKVDSSGNLYVADGNNGTIRKITPAGVVSTIAGVAGQKGSTDGIISVARFQLPYGITIDSYGNFYVTDYTNRTIRKITPAGVVSTIAGLAGQQGSIDGIGSAARFMSPNGITIDSLGNLYVTDDRDHTIKKITPAGVVSTIAGASGQIGSIDGIGSQARFNFPSDITIDSLGNLYVADTINSTIRKITPAGVVSTIAGVAGQTGSSDGTTSTTNVVASIPLVTQVGSWVARPPTIELVRNANNRDVLTYDTASSKWIAAPAPGSTSNSITLDKLSTAGATAGNVLTYNGSTMQWGPAAPANNLPTGSANQVLTYDSTLGRWVGKDITNIVVPTLSLKKNEITTTSGVATYALTLSSDANPENYLVYLNGVMQSPGTDYNISTNGRITLIPAPAGSLKLTVMAVRNTNGAITGGTGGTGGTTITNTTIVNDNISPGSEGQVLTYTSSKWTAANPSVLPSQIKAGGATAGQILSYNGTSWAPINNTPSISPAQIQQAGAKHGEVLVFNSSTNTWSPSSLVGITNVTTTTTTTIVNSDQTSIYKLCEATLYSNPNIHNDGFGFIDSNGDVRVSGNTTDSLRFGPNNITNILGYGTLPLPNGVRAEKLYIDAQNVLVVTTTGDVYISGRNDNGQCAQGSDVVTTQLNLVKAQVLNNIKELAIGSDLGNINPTFFALSNDGKLYSWGYNQYGAIGDNTTTNRSTPVQTLGPGNTYGNSTVKVIQIIVLPGGPTGDAKTTAIALLEDGSVWCTGYGGIGNLGNGTTTTTNSKWVRVKTTPTSFLERITKICGAGNLGNHTIWALNSSGTVWAWGKGGQGQIGDGNNADKLYATQMTTSHLSPSPVIVDFYPFMGSAGSGIFLKDSTGKWYTCGYAGRGNLGLGSTTNKNRMELISALTGQNIQYITTCYDSWVSFAVGTQKLFVCGGITDNRTWGMTGLGHFDGVFAFTEVKLKADMTSLLDVRPINIPSVHANTYAFAPANKKLYLTGCLAWDSQAEARYTPWKIRANFHEITRGVV
jgi:sugar lactone lactonase YvrE